jgi:membrane protease YdiL (CAAX protease family)
MAGGALAVLVAWRVVAAGRATVWAAMGTVLGAAGALSLATGRVPLSPRVSPGWSAAAGVVAGVLLYAATAAFVLVARRWPPFDRHVAEIYDQRRGSTLRSALALAGATAVGEELFWRGLFQSELVEPFGRPAGALITLGVYVAANASSGSLAIVAGAIAGGSAWGVLALWTGGVLASLVCHAVWTVLMLSRPPTGR